MSSSSTSIDYSTNFNSIILLHSYNVIFPSDALSAYEWLFCFLWIESKKKLDKELALGKVR